MLISFTNSLGETLEFDGYYILSPKWDGFGELPVEHQRTKAPYQDGETYIDTVVNTRVPTIEFTILGDDQQEVFNRRRIVARHFNPKLGPGTLKWSQDDGSEYWLDCVPDSPIFPSGDGRGRTFQAAILQFHAFNPFWYDPSEVQRTMVRFEGGWSFPLSFPISFGQIGTQVTVENEGDVDSPALIYLYGEVVNPVIKNLTTGEEIEIVGTVEDGEILIINTAFGEKGALILSDGEYVNVFQYVDPESKFWQLEPGENTLSYTVTSEGENAKCIVMFYHRYSGV
jgi:hypothetical protein